MSGRRGSQPAAPRSLRLRSRSVEDDAVAVRRAALDLRDLLEKLGLPSWIKTSGSKGYHIVVPVAGNTPVGLVARFANEVGTRSCSRATDRAHAGVRQGRAPRPNLRRHRAKRLRRHVRRGVRRSRQARRAGFRAVLVGRDRARRRSPADLHAAEHARSGRAGWRPLGRHATRTVAGTADGASARARGGVNYNPPADVATNGRSGMALRIRICARTADAGTNPSMNSACCTSPGWIDELVCAVAIDHGSTRTVEVRRLIQQLAIAELARSIAHGDRPARHAGALGP